jgi:hypothetical protein
MYFAVAVGERPVSLSAGSLVGSASCVLIVPSRRRCMKASE